MANDFKDLQQAMADLTADMQGLGKSAEKDKDIGVKAFSAAAAKGSLELAKGLGSWAKTVGEGDTSFASLNGVVDIATNAIAGMAKAIPFAGEGLSQVAKAAGEAAKFMIQQMDQTTKAFNDLSKAGALTADGMSGLQKQFVQSGLPLQSFTKLIADNATTLARWTGTSGQGAKDISAIIGSFTQGADMSLRQLGMNAEQIGQTTAAYLTQQTRLGLTQGATTAELIKGTKAYAMDLDQLQKITGQSATSIQAQQDKMLSQSRFRANIDDMVADGHAANAKAIQNFQTEFATMNETVGQGIADLVSGTSEAGTNGGKLMALTGGAALDIVKRLKEGKISQAEASNELKASLKQNQEKNRQLAKNATISNAGTEAYAGTSDIAASQDSDAAKRAAATRKKQIDGTDKLTEDTITAQQAMERLNLEIQEMGFTFMPDAAKATNALSKAIKNAVEYIREAVGGGNTEEAVAKQQAESRRVAGAGGAKSQTAGGGATVVGGAGGEGDAGSIMEAAETGAAERQAAKKATTAAPAEGSPPASTESPTKEQKQQEGKYEPGSGPAPAAPTDPAAAETDPKAQVEKAGLKVRPYGDVYNGGTLTPTALSVAQQIQTIVPNFGFFTGLNDAYHKKKLPDSKHALGRGIDFVLNGQPKPEEAQAIQKTIAGLAGVSLAKNEYFPPPYGQADKRTTGPHMHVQTSAAEGAVLSGPKDGYNPNASMNEVDVKPLNKQALTAANAAHGQETMDPQMFGLQIEQLDLLINSARNQLAVKERILKAKT